MHFVVQWQKETIFQKNGFQQRESQSLGICSCTHPYLNYFPYAYLLETFLLLYVLKMWLLIRGWPGLDCFLI